MNRSSWSYQILVILTFIVVLGLNFSTASQTFRVCEYGCEYSSIERAVNDAASGDQIKILNGNYTENLTIDKDISLTGTNPQWVRITSARKELPTISIGPSSTSVELRNLTVTGEENRGKALSIRGDAELTLTNSLIGNSDTGLQLEDSSHAKLIGTEVHDTTNGILAFGSSEVTVHDSSVTDDKFGLVSDDNSEITVVRSDISRCKKHALLATDTGEINILLSRVTDNQGAGMKLTGFSTLNMEDTLVSNNDGGGVLLGDSAVATLTNNEITYNGKKNLTIISKQCGFSGPIEGFFGKIKGKGNDIVPANPESICPNQFSRIRSEEGGEYSYRFKPATYTFIGLIGAATLFFLLTR